MFNKYLMFILLLVLTSSLYSSTASVVWMVITPGARSNGMGEAFVALADDATASYWNPAGMAFIVDSTHTQEVTLQHCNWLPQLADDLYYEFAGYTSYLEGWGGVGGNIVFMSMGEQVETSAGGEELGTFYSYGFAATVSAGTEIFPGLAAGVGLKFIHDHLYYEDYGKGTSFAADIGLLYKLELGGTDSPIDSSADSLSTYSIIDNPVSTQSAEVTGGETSNGQRSFKINFGACLSNIGPNMSYGGHPENNPLPRMIRVGLALIPLDSELVKLNITADYSKMLVNITEGISEEFKENKWGIGSEFWYYNLLALRAGYIHDTEGESTIQGLTFGAGVQFQNFQLDMSFVPVDEALQSSGKYNQKYSLSIRF